MVRFRLAVLPGDGIGPEVIAEAVKVLRALESTSAEHTFELTEDHVGGAAIDLHASAAEVLTNRWTISHRRT